MGELERGGGAITIDTVSRLLKERVEHVVVRFEQSSEPSAHGVAKLKGLMQGLQRFRPNIAVVSASREFGDALRAASGKVPIVDSEADALRWWGENA